MGFLVLTLMVSLGWEQSVGRGPLRSNLSRRTVLGDLLEGAWGQRRLEAGWPQLVPHLQHWEVSLGAS